MSNALTDFNDLAVACGLAEVNRQIMAVVNQSPKPQASNDDIAPADKAIADQQQKDLNAMLQRYAKIMAPGRATNKVYDLQQKVEYTKTQFNDHIGNKAIAKLWFEASTKTITQDEVIRDRNELISKDDAKGFFNRYLLIYGTKEVWDIQKHRRIEAKAVELSDKEAFDSWIKSPRKKMVDVDNIWFDPSRTRKAPNDEPFVNTFVGLPLKPLDIDGKTAAEKCRPILELLHHLCEYDDNLYLWVVRWLAIPLQKPGTKLDTALIFHGHIQGAGKSLFFDRIMRRVYGEYAVTLGQGQLESSYNDWVAGKLYTVFEEIFTGQDRYKHMGFVKQLVTGDQIYISKKFVSGWKEDNYVNTVFLSNDMMPLSLEVNDRRHVVSYPSAKIAEDLLKRVEVAVNDPNSDMVQAFYTYLLNVDLAGQNGHTPAIMTKAKQQLIKLSQPSWESFYDEWAAGELAVPYSSCLSQDLFKFYLTWCKQNNERSTTATKFLSFIGTREDKRLLWYKTPTMSTRKKSTIICVNIPTECPNQEAYLGDEISKWRIALDDFNELNNPNPQKFHSPYAKT